MTGDPILANMVLAPASAGAGLGTETALVLTVGVLLLLAAMTAMAARRLHLPFTVLLLLLGVGLGVIGRAVGPGEAAGLLAELAAIPERARALVSPDLILFVFLPTLVFESAYSLDARSLARNLGPILVLAVVGLLLSATITAGGMVALLDLPWVPALLFGALISATDPVAVVALFKELGAPKRLHLLVEGESLFNDATAIVAFSILLGFMGGAAGHGEQAGAAAIVLRFLVVFVGGIAVGVALGWVFSWILEVVFDQPSVEIVLTVLLAYASFFVAEHTLHVSGVMAVVAAAMTLACFGRTKLSGKARDFLGEFWELAAWLANALVFLLVGLTVDVGSFAEHWRALAVVVPLTLAARAAAVFGLVPAVPLLRLGRPVGARYQVVMWWGGLRGAIALALALTLAGSQVPEVAALADMFLATAAGVVVFTLVVNALTIRRLMSALGLDRLSPEENLVRTQGLLQAQDAGDRRLDGMEKVGLLFPKSAARVRDARDRRREVLRRQHEEAAAAVADQPGAATAVAARQSLQLCKGALLDLFDQGYLEEDAVKDLQRETDNLLDHVGHTGGLPAEPPPVPQHPLLVRLLAPLETVPLLGRWSRHLQAKRLAHHGDLLMGRYLAARKALEDTDGWGTDADAVREVGGFYQRMLHDARRHLNELAEQYPEYVRHNQELIGTRAALTAERSALESLAEHGAVEHNLVEEVRARLAERLQRLRVRPVSDLDLRPETLLEGVPLLRDLSAEDKRRLADSLRSHNHIEGDVIVREGERGDALYLVGRGVVRVTRSTDDGDDGDETLALLSVGDVFGEMALLDDLPRNASVVAETPCTLLVLRREDFDELCDRHPDLRRRVEATAEERRDT